eukprot:c11541_g1_i1 orf=67-1965(-)
MLSCFPICGRSGGTVIEPPGTTSKAHKCSPPKETTSSNGKDKDQLLSALSCSLPAEGKSSLDMGSLKAAGADAKDMDLFSFSPRENKLMSAMAEDARTIGYGLATDEDIAYPSSALDCHTEEQKLVVSSIVVKDGQCSAEEAKDDEYTTDEGKRLGSADDIPIKEIICSKEERRKEVLVSSVLAVEKEDGFIQGKELEPGGADGIDNLVGKQEQLLFKRIPEEGVTRVPWETNISESPKAENDAIKTISHECTQEKYGMNVPHRGDIGYYDKGKKPNVLFSYGISDQQRDFMFLLAGLVIQAVAFQLKSIVEVITMLILLSYRVYLFASSLIDSLLRGKQKLADAHTMLLSHLATDNLETVFSHTREKWESMKPLLITGAKKMGWGCLNAAYVLAMLSALLFLSFLFSYFAVKGSSTQKPIHITKELYFDYTKSHPVASLDLFSLDAYIRTINASKCIKVPVAGSGPRYRCTVFLTLPESDYNRKLGVFQVTSELLSETGEILVKASKPCMLYFKSNTVHYVKSILMAIPLLSGAAFETQTLGLHLLDWHQEACSPSASMLRIMLVPRAGRDVSNGLPELYKTEVQVDSLQGPWMSSSSIRTIVMWIALSFLVFGCLSSFCMYKLHYKKSTS